MSNSRSQTSAFLNAVIAMDRRTARVAAFVILDPTCSTGRLYVGRVIVSYPRGGAGRVYVVGWMPQPPAVEDPNAPQAEFRHHSWASGGGYDKTSAAMSGAKFWSIKDQGVRSVPDDGYGWQHHLRLAGYDVIQAV